MNQYAELSLLCVPELAVLIFAARRSHKARKTIMVAGVGLLLILSFYLAIIFVAVFVAAARV